MKSMTWYFYIASHNSRSLLGIKHHVTFIYMRNKRPFFEFYDISIGRIQYPLPQIPIGLHTER